MYEKVSPDKILEDLRVRGVRPYDTMELDLSVVRNDVEIDLSGKVFQVIYSTLTSPLLYVKFNDNVNGSIPCQLYQRIVTPFEKVFISNTSQAGTVIILTAQEYENISEVDFFFKKLATPAETDPLFNAWLIATPPLYSETDPVFNAWLSGNPLLWTEASGTLYPTTTANRVLIGGATDDTVSILQSNGAVLLTGTNFETLTWGSQLLSIQFANFESNGSGRWGINGTNTIDLAYNNYSASGNSVAWYIGYNGTGESNFTGSGNSVYLANAYYAIEGTGDLFLTGDSIFLGDVTINNNGFLGYPLGVIGNAWFADSSGSPTTIVSLIDGTFAINVAGNNLLNGEVDIVAHQSLTVNDLVFTYDPAGQYRNGIANYFDSVNAWGNYMIFRVCDTSTSGQTDTLILQGNGEIQMPNLPTSSAGLPTGSVWIDTTGGLNILKIV